MSKNWQTNREHTPWALSIRGILNNSAYATFWRIYKTDYSVKNHILDEVDEWYEKCLL